MRDLETIDSEVRLLAAVRWSIREHWTGFESVLYGVCRFKLCWLFGETPGQSVDRVKLE